MAKLAVMGQPLLALDSGGWASPPRADPRGQPSMARSFPTRLAGARLPAEDRIAVPSNYSAAAAAAVRVTAGAGPSRWTTIVNLTGNCPRET